MDSKSIKDFFLEKLEGQNYTGINGATLTFHIPVHVNLLNFILSTLISSSEGMRDFKVIHFSELGDDEFLLKVEHKRLKKTIRCKINEIEYHNFEPQLTIEFLEGIKFYEKAALNSVYAVKKSWKWLKSVFDNEPKPPEINESVFKITGSKVVIYFSEILKKQDLGFLNPIVKWDRFSTKENSFIIDFRLKIN